jgi:hypothetical protein
MDPVKMPKFEVWCDTIDVTRDGTLGGEADSQRRFMPGLKHYAVDGREVSQREFERLWRLANGD